MFSNQFKTLSLFFIHLLSVFQYVVFTFCNIFLVILPISVFAVVVNLVVGRFKKFSLWSFNGDETVSCDINLDSFDEKN